MDAETPSNVASLFFAGSDDEDQTVVKELPPLNDPTNVAAPAESSERLFLEGSDDDEEETEAYFPSNLKRKGPPIVDNESGDEVQVLATVNKGAVVRNILPKGDVLASTLVSPAPASSLPKRRRYSPSLNTSEPRPCSTSSKSRPYYIGSFIVGNAWATVKGRGYVNPGDEILIERDNQGERPGFRWEKSTAKSKEPDKKIKGKSKQLTLAAMMKPVPRGLQKRTADTIVRMQNLRGFEFGRIPTDVSSWISTLIDMSIVKFHGSTVIDCPTNLHSGADLIVSLGVYLLPSAFKLSHFSAVDQDAKTIFLEGQETRDEQALRDRKHALLRLFDAVGIRPSSRSRPLDSYEQERDLSDKAMKQMRIGSGSTRKEIVGDGEEIEVEEGEELSENELNAIYKKAQANDRTMATMDPPDTFTLTLRGYQKQALRWMHALETGTMAAREATSIHPLWSEYVFPPEPGDDVIDLTQDDKPFYFNPYSGELSLDFPKAEQPCKGGILADEMGMGKTIMVSALIHTLHEPGVPESPDLSAIPQRNRQLKLDSAFRPISREHPQSTKGPSATLIVAPTSLLTQWSDELLRSSKPGTLNVVIWHGQNRRDLESAIEDDNEGDETIRVVVTSYGVLASEHAKLEKSVANTSPIFEIEWLRVVLDEAHHCKSRISKTARAVYALRARRRWAVTGTPIVNKLEDLFSLLKFLDFKPWSDFSFFRSFITLPFLDCDPKAVEIVQVILESVLLRREKTMLDTDGKRIVDLPAKEVVVETLEFSPLERKIYDSIYRDAKRDFDELSAKGLIGRNYTHILALIMRLRRAVLHPNLVLSPQEGLTTSSAESALVGVDELIQQFARSEKTSGSKNVFAGNVLANLDVDETQECPICFDIMQLPMIIPGCLHQSCKDCIIAFLATCQDKGEEGRCPTCLRRPVSESDLLEVVRPNSTNLSSQSSLPEIILRRNDFRSSTKLEALRENLIRLRDQDPCFRAVIFSQFTSFLDLIEIVLKRECLDFYRFDGSMDSKKRNQALSEFRSHSKRPKVLIISLKAGGVGLNLTTANHVFMMDCWWNAATENQAIDRVHRIGQEKTVYVKHFIVDNTIEGRILQIQKRKTAIIKEAFRGSDRSRADPESIENLKIMFGDD